MRLTLELNAKSVSVAVSAFIKYKLFLLARQKQYDKQIQDAVLEHLISNANGTFLWVALVCQELEKTAKRHVQKKLNSFPPELDALYERMIQHIGGSEDVELCKQMLASIALVYRPTMLKELVTLVEPLEDLADETAVREIIGLCGSFLTLQKDTVYFVHQSAKDFLITKAVKKVFPRGTTATHGIILSRSLVILSRTLHRDMYGLEAPGLHIDNVQTPRQDPLAASRYPCIYWIDHLYDSKLKPLANNDRNVQVGSVIDEFLRKKYLYWLEGLSLCKSLERGVASMAKLWSLVQVLHLQTAIRSRC